MLLLWGLTFNSFLASNNFRHLLIMLANSLDPDQEDKSLDLILIQTIYFDSVPEMIF